MVSATIILFSIQTSSPIEDPANYSIRQIEVPSKKIILNFPINNTNESMDGEVIADNISLGKTNRGKFTIENFSNYPQNITLKIGEFRMNYIIPKSLEESRIINLIISQGEYLNYKSYQELYNNDLFKNVQIEHWNHMPLKYTTNFSDYSDPAIYKSKELKVKYTLERLNNAVPSITFQRVSEQEADIVFRGEIPRQIREANRPDGNSNIAGLAFHNTTGKIIFRATVYIPLPAEGEECPSSDIALHELLHTFGLPHSNNIKSVLWDTTSCTNNEIVQEDVILLKSIYG